METIRVPKEVHPDCREFVSVVEELLARRRYEVLLGNLVAPAWRQDDWGPRKWYHTELEDMVYSSYKRMRQGHITRPPRREIIMEIASYLNCTLHERNRLLIAAHTFPVEVYFTGIELQRLVKISSEVAQNFAMPTMVINRDWRIHYLNDYMLTFYDISLAQLAAIPQERLNVLFLLFDPALPLYPSLTANCDSWRKMAMQTIYGFKMANFLCQFETWYQRIVNELMELPDFAQCWEDARIDMPFVQEATLETGVIFETTLPKLQDQSKRVSLRPISISISYFQFNFPQIIGFVPANPATQCLFREMGLPFPTFKEGTSTGHFVL